MSRKIPCIVCIGVIGRHDNPLHISLFPPTSLSPTSSLEMEFLLNSSLDIFASISLSPQKRTSTSHEFGLLQAIDEHLAMYGWLTNTSVKFVVIVDMQGRSEDDPDIAGRMDNVGTANARSSSILGVREQDLRVVFRAVQRAYVSLLRNPFYDPDEHDPSKPGAVIAGRRRGANGLAIASKGFKREIDRIGRLWYPGITAL